jgi:hypothetical protein
MRLFDFAGASGVDWLQMSRHRLHLALIAIALIAGSWRDAHALAPPGEIGYRHATGLIGSEIQDSEAAEKTLEKIERAMQTADIRSLSGYFSSRVYLNLPSGEKGYYSAEQTFFIIKGFFQSYSPVSFAFSNSRAQGDCPYGMGTLAYIKVGQRGKLQVFVSLRDVNHQWKINQITIAQR